MVQIEKLQTVLDQIKVDAEKFTTKGNSAAGTRVRKGLQELKALAQEARLAVTEAKNEKKG